jgi:hypothetical protein
VKTEVRRGSTEWENERLVVSLDNEGVHVDVVDGDGSHSITIEADDLMVYDFIPLEHIKEHCPTDHCGDPDCSCPPSLDFGSDAVKAIEDWHNRRHAGVFRFCIEDPCIAFVKAVNEL